MTITCVIQHIDAVTIAIKVLHNSCNMYTLNLTDTYAFSLRPVALMLVHAHLLNYLCTCYNYLLYKAKKLSFCSFHFYQVVSRTQLQTI